MGCPVKLLSEAAMREKSTDKGQRPKRQGSLLKAGGLCKRIRLGNWPQS